MTRKDRGILNSIMPDDVMKDSLLAIQIISPIILSAYEGLRQANLSPEEAQNFILAMLGLEPLSKVNKKNLKKIMEVK